MKLNVEIKKRGSNLIKAPFQKNYILTATVI